MKGRLFFEAVIFHPRVCHRASWLVGLISIRWQKDWINKMLNERMHGKIKASTRKKKPYKSLWVKATGLRRGRYLLTSPCGSLAAIWLMTFLSSAFPPLFSGHEKLFLLKSMSSTQGVTSSFTAPWIANLSDSAVLHVEKESIGPSEKGTVSVLVTAHQPREAACVKGAAVRAFENRCSWRAMQWDSAFGSEHWLACVGLLLAESEGSEKSPRLVCRLYHAGAGGTLRVLLIIASDGLLDTWCPITGFDSTRLYINGLLGQTWLVIDH